MNAIDQWPLPAEVADWWRDRPLTVAQLAQLDQMAEEYAREQMATAQSEAAFADNVKEFNRE
jgi:hypothetical protein